LVKSLRKKLSLLIVFLLLFTLSIPIASVQAASIQIIPERLAGSSRTLTAVEVSQEGWPDGSSAVVLTRGDDFPDALAGSTLAAAYNSPILLTDSKTLSPETDSEITRLHPSTVYILGGTGAVSASVESYLSSKYTVKRLADSSRYDTAAAIALYLKDAGKLKTTKAVIAYAQNFPDALAISSWAAYNGVPILLSETNTIPDATNKAISNLGITQTIIVGGPGVISPSVESLLPSPTRYGGLDRYDTAMQIATSLGTSTEKIFIATGKNFPDALAGSALAAKTGSTIILVDNGLPSPVSQFISKNKDKIQHIYILGGEEVVLPGSVNSILNTQRQTGDISQDEQIIVDLANKERAAAGLKPLQVDMQLMEVSRIKAADMKENNYFSHSSPKYGSPFDMMSAAGISFSSAGENIAGDLTAEAAMAAWMNSEGHRQNILNLNFTHIGVGVSYGTAYVNYYVQQFIQK